MSEAPHFQPGEVPSPEKLHEQQELKDILLSRADSDQRREEIEQTFDPDNETLIGEINAAGFSPESHQELLYAALPALDAVMAEYAEPTESPKNSERNKLSTEARRATHWYMSLEPGRLPDEYESDLVSSARVIARSETIARDINEYEQTLEQKLSAACMLMEAADINRDNPEVSDVTRQQGYYVEAAKVLDTLTHPKSEARTVEARRLDDWYKIQAQLYFADVVDRMAQQKGVVSRADEIMVGVLPILEEFMHHYPGKRSDGDVVGLKTEIAIQLLFRSYAKQAQRRGKNIQVRKAYTREDTPHDGRTHAGQRLRAADAVLTYQASDGERRYAIQSKTGRARSAEEAGYQENIDIATMEAADVDDVLKSFQVLHSPRSDSRQQEIATERIVINRSALLSATGVQQRIES